MVNNGGSDITNATDASSTVTTSVASENSNASEQLRGSWWNIMNIIKPSSTRSPLTSPRNSIENEPNYTGRRHSFMTPEMEQKIAQRRASLEKLQVQKIAPWMYLYDFTASDSDSRPEN